MTALFQSYAGGLLGNAEILVNPKELVVGIRKKIVQKSSIPHR